MMIPETTARAHHPAHASPVRCIRSGEVPDPLSDLGIGGNCFLLLLLYEGSLALRAEDALVEATGPAFVCFDESTDLRLLSKREVTCDAVFFHPTFFNVNLTFERVHDAGFDETALNHDLFLMHPFTSPVRIFPMPGEFARRASELFDDMERELRVQSDFYWSCRSRSRFIELILLLERVYGLVSNTPDAESSEQTALQTHPRTTAERINDPAVRSAVLFLESHFAEDVSNESICRASAVNHTTLTRRFKAELGMTPMEYLWRYRLTVAKKQLAFTGLPVREIACACGFKTVPHFCRKFEAYTGRTPTAFREEALARRKIEFG